MSVSMVVVVITVIIIMSTAMIAVIVIVIVSVLEALVPAIFSVFKTLVAAIFPTFEALAITRHVSVVIPAVLHEIDAAAARIVFTAMLTPVLGMAWRHAQIERFGN